MSKPPPGWTPEQWKAANAAYWRACAEASRRVPLTTNQHILHLLLTVFTGGLWSAVWITRAVQGNRVADPALMPSWPPAPPG